MYIHICCILLPKPDTQNPTQQQCADGVDCNAETLTPLCERPPVVVHSDNAPLYIVCTDISAVVCLFGWLAAR